MQCWAGVSKPYAILKQTLHLLRKKNPEDKALPETKFMEKRKAGQKK